MRIGYCVVMVLLSAQPAFSWGWHWRGKAGAAKAPGSVTWRSAGFAKNNRDLNEACNKLCTNNREHWTTQWKTSWRGSAECACKVAEKKSFFAKQKAEEKPHDVTYRHIGIFRSPEDLASECPKLCGTHNEKYTGNWDHKWIGGYRCECKHDASLATGKVTTGKPQEKHAA